MTDSIRAQILENMATRLDTIKQANGYGLDVYQVFYDEIPMGIQIQDDFLPAIVLIDSIESMRMEQNNAIGTWELELQLWQTRVGDLEMNEYVRNVIKCIFANSPTAESVQGVRQLHPNVRQVRVISITPDLNLIEANRVYSVTLQVEYKAKIFNL